MIVWSFDSQLQLNCQQVYCSHETSFHFWMNRWKDIIRLRYKLMKSVKIKINRETKRVCHRFLPIDRYNRYQSNQFFRFLSIHSSIDKSIPIFIDWLLRDVYMCHAISFMSYDVSDSERFSISQEAMLFFLPRLQIFVFWLFSRIKFCFKSRRTLNVSQETLLGLFL